TTSTSTSSTGSSWGVQWLNSVLNPPDDPAPTSNATSRSSTGTHPRRRGRRRDDPSTSTPNPQQHKRATSPDPDTAAAGNEQEEQSTLVYVHTVKPTDTLEGIAITYNTTRDGLRRANGMWAQDGVGTRKTLLLPVDECGTKGITVPAPPQAEGGAAQAKEEGERTGAGTGTEEGERRYKHHSYVTIPHVGTVEIARLPRKKLSHFPPRRRRSHRAHTHSVSPGRDDYSAHRELLAPPDVFRGMTAGVGDLHPHTTHSHGGHGGHGGGHAGEQTVTIGPTFKTLSELAQDTAVGLENVGSVMEGFVRRWTVKASDFVGGDLIELTQRLGFDEGGGQGMERGLSGSGGGGGGGSGRSMGGGVERRVVRERLPRREGER
ncbi:hypothetical protein DFP73DRAFT_456545, partial [Morchella snyderi]